MTYKGGPPTLWRCGPTRAMVSSFVSFLDHTQRDAPQSVGLHSCTVPEAVGTVLCTPDDGCGWHPKHVE